MSNPSDNSNDPFNIYHISKHDKSFSMPDIDNSTQEQLPSHNSNDDYGSYDPYYLSMRSNSRCMPSIDNSTQERLPSQKLHNSSKLPMLDNLIEWLPEWAYFALKGFGSLIGFALLIVTLGFIVHFILVHSSSLF